MQAVFYRELQDFKLLHPQTVWLHAALFIAQGLIQALVLLQQSKYSGCHNATLQEHGA
jgi:hypothetical protein